MWTGNDEPDPEQIRRWGLELPEGSAVVYRHAGGKSRFATFGSANRAAQRPGPATTSPSATSERRTSHTVAE